MAVASYLLGLGTGIVYLKRKIENKVGSDMNPEEMMDQAEEMMAQMFEEPGTDNGE